MTSTNVEVSFPSHEGGYNAPHYPPSNYYGVCSSHSHAMQLLNTSADATRVAKSRNPIHKPKK